MRNKYGKTLKDRLNEDIEFAKKTYNKRQREKLAIKVLGAADLAVEFGLITYGEWSAYINKIFKLIRA